MLILYTGGQFLLLCPHCLLSIFICSFPAFLESRNISVGMPTRLKAGRGRSRRWIGSWGMRHSLLLCRTPTSGLGPSQAVSLGLKRQGREAGHTVVRLRIVEIYLHSLPHIHGVMLSQLKPFDNFTFQCQYMEEFLPSTTSGRAMPL
jgi:hypothetical protein